MSGFNSSWKIPTARSAAFNACAATLVLGGLFSIILMEDRLKQLFMPVQEARHGYCHFLYCLTHIGATRTDAEVWIWWSGLTLQALEGTWFAKLWLLILLSKACWAFWAYWASWKESTWVNTSCSCSVITCCDRHRNRAPWSFCWPRWWSLRPLKDFGRSKMKLEWIRRRTPEGEEG